MRRLLIVVAAVVLAGGVVAGRRFGVLRLPLPIHPAARSARSAPKPPKPVNVTVPAITTNLGDAGGGHFVQVALTVTLSGPAAAKQFTAHLPAVEDAVIADLRSATAAQLNGPGGMQLVQRSVTASVAKVLGSSGLVRAVYFTQFIVQ